MIDAFTKNRFVNQQRKTCFGLKFGVIAPSSAACILIFRSLVVGHSHRPKQDSQADSDRKWPYVPARIGRPGQPRARAHRSLLHFSIFGLSATDNKVFKTQADKPKKRENLQMKFQVVIGATLKLKPMLYLLRPHIAIPSP